MNSTEIHVLRMAADILGVGTHTLTLETKLDDLFADSLEYLDFTLQLGNLSDEAIAKAETLGDLANALSHTN